MLNSLCACSTVADRNRPLLPRLPTEFTAAVPQNSEFRPRPHRMSFRQFYAIRIRSAAFRIGSGNQCCTAVWIWHVGRLSKPQSCNSCECVYRNRACGLAVWSNSFCILSDLSLELLRLISTRSTTPHLDGDRRGKAGMSLLWHYTSASICILRKSAIRVAAQLHVSADAGDLLTTRDAAGCASPSPTSAGLTSQQPDSSISGSPGGQASLQSRPV